MERLNSSLDPQIAKVMERLNSSLDPQIAKALERFNSSLDPQIAKALERFNSSLDSQLAKVLERLNSPLEHTHLGKLFQDSYFGLGTALAGVSVESLLKELKSRRKDFTDESDFNPEPQAQSIEAGGHATASATATGDARVEKAEAKHPVVKTQDLSFIPTWFIRFVLQLLLRSIELMAQWEDLRESVVDLNARLPQTESPSTIRNFIRKELAGKPGDIRLVTGSDVNFRFDPSSKSEVILKLPKNAIVVVQGKEDRTWLLVSYEVKGYWIDGYVSTKYLKKVRKD